MSMRIKFIHDNHIFGSDLRVKYAFDFETLEFNINEILIDKIWVYYDTVFTCYNTDKFKEDNTVIKYCVNLILNKY